MLIKSKNDRSKAIDSNWNIFTKGDFRTKDTSFVGYHYFDDNLARALITIHINYSKYKFRINSTFRSASYNKRYNGAINSEHTKGKAVDFCIADSTGFFDKKATNDLADELKSGFKTKSGIYQTIHDVGINGIVVYDSFIHFDTGNEVFFTDVRGQKQSTPQDGIREQNNIVNAQNKSEKLLPVSKEYYLARAYNISLDTVDKFLEDPNSLAKGYSGKTKDFLEYKDSVSTKTNLEIIWAAYTDAQKKAIDSSYSSLSKEQKRSYKPSYKASVTYPLNKGTVLMIPKTRANVEVFASIGKGLYMEQRDIKTAINKEFQAIYNDPTYIKTQNVEIQNGAYTVNYLHLSFTVWIYIKSIDKIINITPFVKNVTTSVSGSGSFSLSLLDISSLDDLFVAGSNYYNYFHKVQNGKYNLSFFQKQIQQNDIVWIRFEELDIERRKNEEITLEVDKKDIPNKIYDMIGLVDSNQENYVASANDPMISISGRDFNKLLEEDSCNFFPYSLQNNSDQFFLQHNPTDGLFNRLFATGEFFNLFQKTYRTIVDSLGFVFNQLSNTGLLQKEIDLFSYYKNSFNPDNELIEDRRTFVYTTKGKATDPLDGKRLTKGIWQITKLLVDEQLDNRRLCNGEISNPDGALRGIVEKICQQPFVEFWGDTHYDQFVFSSRQPPFTRTQIQDYFDNNLVIEIDSSCVSSFTFGWCEEYYTWYQISPMQGIAGTNQFISAANMPIVYFEEYAEVFGIHKKQITDYYTSYESLIGSEQVQDLNLFRKAVTEDLKYIIESSSILPFTRNGNIVLRVGDRRIKKGSWIYFKPTNEIFYVTSVKQSASANRNGIDRMTEISVERGMIKNFAVSTDSDKTNTSFSYGNNMISYWNIVNLDVITKRLASNTENGETKVNNSSVGQALINKDVFNFFLQRKQFDAQYNNYSYK